MIASKMLMLCLVALTMFSLVRHLYIICVTLNTESGPLQFVKIGGPMTRLTKMYDTSP